MKKMNDLGFIELPTNSKIFQRVSNMRVHIDRIDRGHYHSSRSTNLRFTNFRQTYLRQPNPTQRAPDMGLDGAELSCPGSSVVACGRQWKHEVMIEWLRT